MCIYGGHMYICLPNMKFLCLTLWQGEICTDDANAANANDNGQSMIVLGFLVDKPNEPKNSKNQGNMIHKTSHTIHHCY